MQTEGNIVSPFAVQLKSIYEEPRADLSYINHRHRLPAFMWQIYL